LHESHPRPRHGERSLGAEVLPNSTISVVGGPTEEAGSEHKAAELTGSDEATRDPNRGRGHGSKRGVEKPLAPFPKKNHAPKGAPTHAFSPSGSAPQRWSF
jgi:hypothetical protein